MQDRLVEELLEGVEAVTQRWHEELRRHLDIRPENVFHSDELLDHMPDVVRWVITSIQRDDEMDRASVASVQEAARHWREAGYTVEESLMHLRMLSQLLHREIREISGGFKPPPDAQTASLLSERMSHGIMLLQVVLVGAYHDEDQRQLDDLGNMLVHEIRNPLGAALSGLQLLEMLEDDGAEGDDVENRRRRVLERSIQALSPASRMVSSIHHLVRASATSIPQAEPRSLRTLVSEVVEQLSGEAGAVEVRQDEIPAVQVPGDVVRLALHNLVQNAIRYADRGKPDPYVRVYCRYEESAEQWLLCVEDNGVGIPEGERQDIFRRFRRGRAARGDGLGLGLSIVREAAASIGGEVIVESSEWNGTTFLVAIPAEKTSAEAAPSSAQAART